MAPRGQLANPGEDFKNVIALQKRDPLLSIARSGNSL
jgi:hypothetical protein